MHLLETPSYTLAQKTKVVELTGEYTLRDSEGRPAGTVVEVGHGAAHKALRAITGTDQFLNRVLEVRDVEGNLAAVVSRNRGLWREVVTVKDATGNVVGIVRIRLFAPSLPLPSRNVVVDDAGHTIGTFRTKGLRRRDFELELDGQVVATCTQPWAGFLKEAFTQADRFVYHRVADVAPQRLAVAFALPLFAELSFKQGGGVSPLREALNFLT